MPRAVLPRPRSRRRLLAAGTLAVVLAAGGTVAAIATPPQALTAAEQERGMAPGAPLTEPPVIEASAGVEVTLDPAKTRFSISGKDVWGASYAGAIVAPTLRLDPGTTASITVRNRLQTATNLHFHGLHVSPEGSSDNPMVCIPPGAAYTYRLSIPADHPQGTYWYHSHAMSTSCPNPNAVANGHSHATPGFMPADTENQILAGLSGAIVIGDSRTGLPGGLRDVPERVIALKDAQIDVAGKIVQNTANTSIDSNADTVRLVNGQLRPVLSLRPGETELWRVANLGADIFYRLRLDGYRFSVVAEDGNPLPVSADATELLLPPGKRFDVLVTASQTAGSAVLRTLAYSNGPGGDQYPDTQLARLDIGGAPTASLPAADVRIAGAQPDLAGAPIAQRRRVVLSEEESTSQFFINGKQFGMDSPTFDLAAKLGTVEEWTVTNVTGEDHPFHMHSNAFQVMSVNGAAPASIHRQDTVVVPHAVNGVPGTVVLRQAFTDYPGRWMFHCHIAAHEDHGMMGYIQVVP
ncbi:multicopper oxidase family protein [Sinomonas notoginsengisoli]|uniref:multicopper oxidase family protein n=1 Tax=Sinomonas notoginsengisoli TaxID=1457311 RepID=UPI001F20B787|nr:multicopper oxidase family protein [Sinomonas notoginsengisoli]